eukprot:1937565-Alexandrium_andersonii.AAC.1
MLAHIDWASLHRSSRERTGGLPQHALRSHPARKARSREDGGELSQALANIAMDILVTAGNCWELLETAGNCWNLLETAGKLLGTAS